MTAPVTVAPLPSGIPLAVDPDVRRLDGGRVLVGGNPGTLLRLSEAGVRALAGLTAGRAGTAAAGRLARRLVEAGLAHPRPAGAGTAQVTVVVPVRDRATELARCLAALGPGVPVVVVDDGSVEPAGVAAVCASAGARLVRRPGNGGPAAARNDGVAATATPLVAFLDSDCVPPPGWPGALTGHFADPLVAAVAPRVVPAGAADGLLARYAAARGPLDLGPREAPVRPGSPVPYVPTAALVARRAALAAVPFDDGLRYGEDVDLVWRLHDAGWQVRYDPRDRVLHEEPQEWSTWLARRAAYGTSAAPLALRHGQRLTPLVLQPWPAAVVVLLLLRCPVLAAAVTGAGALRLHRRLRRSGVPGAASGRLAAALTARALVGTVTGLGGAGAVLTLPVLIGLLGARRTRATAAAALLLSPLLEHRSRRPAVDPLRWVLLRWLEDGAYASGVWRGCWAERTVVPLLPRLRRPR